MLNNYRLLSNLAFCHFFIVSLIPLHDDTIKIKRKESLKREPQVVQEKLVRVNFSDHKKLSRLKFIHKERERDVMSLMEFSTAIHSQ